MHNVRDWIKISSKIFGLIILISVLITLHSLPPQINTITTRNSYQMMHLRTWSKLRIE